MTTDPNILRERNKLWVEALRSGAFKQTIEVLKAKDIEGDICHCALGVAAEVFLNHAAPEDNHKGIKWEEVEELNYFLVGSHGNAYEVSVPPEVADWYGWKQDDPPLTIPGNHPRMITKRGRVLEWPTVKSVSTVNDLMRLNFEEIAELVEARYCL